MKNYYWYSQQHVDNELNSPFSGFDLDDVRKNPVLTLPNGINYTYVCHEPNDTWYAFPDKVLVHEEEMTNIQIKNYMSWQKNLEETRKILEKLKN